MLQFYSRVVNIANNGCEQLGLMVRCIASFLHSMHWVGLGGALGDRGFKQVFRAARDLTSSAVRRAVLAVAGLYPTMLAGIGSGAKPPSTLPALFHLLDPPSGALAVTRVQFGGPFNARLDLAHRALVDFIGEGRKYPLGHQPHGHRIIRAIGVDEPCLNNDILILSVSLLIGQSQN